MNAAASFERDAARDEARVSAMKSGISFAQIFA
jgi:hypothetical protein